MAKQRSGVYKTCLVCGKEFYVPRYRKDIAKYCSRYCQNHGQYEHIQKVCAGCGKTFVVSNSRVSMKYCSEDCRQVHAKTERERRKIQKTLQKLRRGNNHSRNLRNWLRAIGFRFKCANCGYEEYEFCIDIHHLDGDPHNNALENLVPLCAICHRLVTKGLLDVTKLCKPIANTGGE